MKTAHQRTYQMEYEVWATAKYLNSPPSPPRCYERKSVTVTSPHPQCVALQQALQLVTQQAEAKGYVNLDLRVKRFEKE